MRTLRTLLLVGVATVPLVACGSSPQDRAVTGAGVGAAAGALSGALIPGLSVGTGALIGVGAGALTGALTQEKDFNLGRPIWKWGQN